jgi:3-methyl-2-oxobutanoate hydroxymethyltransferase
MMNACRLIKEGNMDSVKMEGGADRADVIRAVVKGGIAVMGHVGLTPQSFSALGGFKAQGRTASQAMQVCEM